MTAIGKIESFDGTKENWETYVERVGQFFLAKDIDDDRKVPTLCYETDWSVDFGICRSKSDCCQKPN